MSNGSAVISHSNKNMIKVSAPERTFMVINYVILSLFFIVCLYPFWYVLVGSISNQADMNAGVAFFPAHVVWENYTGIFQRGDIPGGFLISILRTVIGTVLCVVLSAFIAFLVTKEEMLLRKVVYRFIIVSMYLNAGLIPWYLTMRTYGLGNNFLLYILPGAVNAWFMILIRVYIESLPASLQESAEIDGAGLFTVFVRIIIPLCKPIIATVVVFCAVGQWNAWYDAFFLVDNSKLFPLQLILYNYINQAQAIAQSMATGSASAGLAQSASQNITPAGIQMAVTVISVVPVMLLYPFAQKYFVKGIMMGSIKG